MSTALARRESLLPDAATWATMLDMAGKLVESGLLPQGIKTPAAALAIMQKGSELGIPPMYALSNIGIIGGKPVVGAEVMLAMIYRDHGDNAIQIEDTSNERCSVVYRRRGWPQARRFEWTTEDAKQAGLLGKGGPWTQYPGAMLRARCISAVARLAFADSIGGLYTHEELGAEVEVVDGEVVVVQSPAPILRTVQASEVIEPSGPEEERARAMASVQATEVPGENREAVRQRAIRRYKQLAKIAKERGHDKAEAINAVEPETLSPAKLKGSVLALEGYFPDVAEEVELDEMAF